MEEHIGDVILINLIHAALPRFKNEIQNLKKGRLIGSMNMLNHFGKKKIVIGK